MGPDEDLATARALQATLINAGKLQAALEFAERLEVAASRLRECDRSESADVADREFSLLAAWAQAWLGALVVAQEAAAGAFRPGQVGNA